MESPWIHQLTFKNKHEHIGHNFATDIVVVGAGIAGICTAYFVLKNTAKKVTVIEAAKVAHGATGHNAGQIVSYFEHPFAHLVEEYGLTLAAKAQESIYHSWDLLEEIFNESNITTPLSIFTGYAGCSSLDQVLLHLGNLSYQRQAGLKVEEVLVADIPEIIDRIPKEFEGLYGVVDQEYILSILETKDTRYIASLASRKGCLNSALFCEDVVEYLLKTYPDRFNLFEHSPVSEIQLQKAGAKVLVNNFAVAAERVVLCTNGFENFTITNYDRAVDVNASFHSCVNAKVGYMSAYLEEANHKPVAISYFSNPGINEETPYFYFTRRRFIHKERGEENLICLGGPEGDLPVKGVYSREEHVYPDSAKRELDAFIRGSYRYAPHETIDYLFQWHGIMGYTPTGLRVIGPEPRNPVLMYNLGCNGVGILSSVYGGKRISQFLNNPKLEKSVFDPR
jgi:glycine/D-amino acid oxidase-like deaminating enzyme